MSGPIPVQFLNLFELSHGLPVPFLYASSLLVMLHDYIKTWKTTASFNKQSWVYLLCGSIKQRGRRVKYCIWRLLDSLGCSLVDIFPFRKFKVDCNAQEHCVLVHCGLHVPCVNGALKWSRLLKPCSGNDSMGFNTLTGLSFTCRLKLCIEID